MIEQNSGAPVWLYSVAQCEMNVLQWLVDNGPKLSVFEPYVWYCDELGLRCV